MCYVYELLRDEYSVTAFYYNPNIAPKKEYQIRLNELVKFSAAKGFDLIQGEYNQSEWVKQVKPYRYLGERSERCRECIQMRLRATFQKAADTGADLVGTALTISPHKDAEMINNTGNELSKQYGIPFLVSDFKKNNGFRKSVEYSKEYNFFRQNYCGCIYSKMERSKDSLWYKNTQKYRETGPAYSTSVE